MGYNLFIPPVVHGHQAFIMGWWLGKRKMKKGLDESKSLRNAPQNAAYDVPTSTMQTNPAYVTLEACMTTQ